MNSKITPFDSPTAAAFDELEIKQKNLQLFKHLLETSRTGLQFYPYTLKKKYVLLYKAIFFGIGIFLAALGLYIYTASYNFIAMHLFSAGYFAKIFIVGLSSVLSATAFIQAAKTQPHKEIILDIIKTARKKVYRLYRKKIFFLKYQRTVENCEIEDAKTSWDFLLEDVLETFQEKKEASLLLSDRIYLSKVLSVFEKEKLFNEALYELQNTVNKIVQDFCEGRNRA